ATFALSGSVLSIAQGLQHETLPPCGFDHDGYHGDRRGIDGLCAAKRLRARRPLTADAWPGRPADRELPRDLWRLRWRTAWISRSRSRSRTRPWWRLARRQPKCANIV